MGGGKRPSSGDALEAPRKKPKAGSAKALTQETGKLSGEEAEAYFKANQVNVSVPDGKDVDIAPLSGFRHDGFAKKLMKYCEGKFESPTPIQACCWPIIMQRCDVCGIAKTGSGKTMGFALPYLSMSRKGILENFEQPVNTPRFVCMAPTRELAMQIAEVCTELSQALGDGYPVLCVYGGVPKREQRRSLQEEGVDMLIACPGRLQDLANDGSVDLSHVQYLVLDEADRMLDMGFIDTVKGLIDQMPKAGVRQTCMFSATWPASIHHLATQFLASPAMVAIGNFQDSGGLAANKAIRQEVEVLKDEKEKPTRLLHHLKKHYAPDKKVIVFGLYKKEAAWLENFLWGKGYEKVIALQGDMSQEKRTKAIADFKETKSTPLIATDVASRGLDVKDVELVINYTFPLTIEDYIHRIGRTGRAGKSGLAICFFCPESKGAQDEKAHAGDLVRVLKEAGQTVPPDLERLSSTSGGNKATKKKDHPLFGKFFKSAEQMAALEAKKVHTTFADSDDE
uniref:RNA helicase n=1 Tax=Alexandrium monilatum TaxID=311494 RepID=A0A7S4SFD2_9DINO|mmetsp:Transcript_29344/g.91439  ORF Transcript_29344/g.91439 Transcript_29344/m.91439 type:complete len:510 (-) Transcript_29344:114-1643(-)|eukprot:CAMPEP_0175215086 /NCGR_PEP_ID=MMETSP0093-20121207/17036_1 /TAXON_ID=311494 /ORGANISM="Alexandrium monilatum, Strain CCMP3105" /LENGTH=509 /DNA_ID=CAMNT_0016508449 /DNA_START=78 /DNA_END=1607 /DNA_ORIENTATION=+